HACGCSSRSSWRQKPSPRSIDMHIMQTSATTRSRAQEAERPAAEPRRVNDTFIRATKLPPAVGSSGWFGTLIFKHCCTAKLMCRLDQCTTSRQLQKPQEPAHGAAVSKEQRHRRTQ